MKKNNIFKHELNESIQANAALNCLKNRNTPKKLNESKEFDTRFHYRSDLKKLANPVTKKAYMLLYNEFGDNMWRQLGIDDADEQTLIGLLNDMQHYSNNPRDIADFMLGRKSIRNFKQEQEEHPEDANRLQTQLANAWDEGMEDDEDDYVPYNNTFDETHHDIVDNLISAVEYYFDTDDDVSGFYHYDYTEDQLGKAVEKVLDKYGDFPSSNNFDKCYAWTKKHVEELMKILETGSLENPYEGHPEFDFSEQEEMPQMERHDIALACSYCLGESFIDNDGDLDDIYYAVLKVFDSTYDAPATTDYKEVLQWCRKYYKQIEELITTEEQEEQIFKVRTKQGFVEVPLSSEVVDAFHDNLDPRYEDMDTQAALKGINGGARLAALIAGMMEQGYKPTPDEQHILELHYNAKKAVNQSQADSSDRNINAYSD